MKKQLWIAAIATLVMAGCSEDALVENVVNGSSVLNASFESGDKTRVAVGDDNTLTWSEGDQFVVLSDGGAGCYTLSGQGGSTTGTFTGTLPSGTVVGAAFPFVDAATQPSLSGSTLTMTLPAEISFEENVCDAPMWAGITSNDVESISFKHLVSMLKVDLSGIPATAGQLIVDASAPIAGKFTADITKSGDDLVLVAATGATNSITVEFTPSSSSNQQLFLIPIPVGTYTSFALSYANEDGTGKTFLKSWSNLEFKRAKPNKATIAIGNIEADLNSDYAVDGNTYTIKTVDGLFWFAEQVNGGNDFAGKTVELGNDINLNNVAWTPIGNNCNSNAPITFNGTFDGKDKTISNLNVDTSELGEHAPAGLFGYASTNAVIKNLNVSNVSIKALNYAGAIVGYLQALDKEKIAMVQKCTVNSGTITVVTSEDDHGNNAGGIAGYMCYGTTIDQCNVEGITITGYRDLGGIVGTVNLAKYKTKYVCTVTLTGNTISGVTITQDTSNDYKTPTPTTIGEIYGRKNGSGSTFVENGNTSNNFTNNAGTNG